MKKILLFAFLLCSFSAFAQYPATPTTKQELGRQTTGDGLIYRGSGAPAYTPSNNRNAWIYYDTTNNRLYKSRLGSWSLMVQDTSAFNEIQMPYIIDDTLYLTQNVTGEPLTAYINRVWPIAALSDTASITGENQGDVAFVTGGTAVAFRGSAYWNPFSGGGGGGSFNDFILAADSGSPATIADGQTVTIAGGAGLTSTISGNTVTTNLDNTAITAATYGSATQVSQITFDAQGRGILATNVSILLPISAVTALPDSLVAKITRIASTNNYLPRWVGTSMGNSFLSQDAVSVMMDANKQFELTGGTTANRPTGVASAMYYNTSNNWFDFHNGTSWFNPLRSATATGLGTSTYVGVFDGSGLMGGSSGLTYNGTGLGIGILSPGSRLDVQTNNLGTTQTNTSGLLLSNTTAALSAAQQISPAIRFRGFGWGTTAGTSQSTDWRMDVLPVQGTVPTSLLRFQSSVNNALYNNSNSVTFGSNGTLGVGTQTAYTSGSIRMATSTDATITSGWYNVDFVLGGYTHDLGVSNGGGYIDFRKISGGTVISRIHSNGNSYLMGGNVGIGTTSPDRLFHSELSDAVTNAIVFPLRLTHTTSGTAAAGSGAGLEFEAESAGGTNRVAGTIENPYTTATNAAEVSDLVFRTMRAGTLTESLRSLGNGTLRIGTLSGTASKIGAFTSGNIATVVTPTITTAGTTGDRTINELAGTVNIAAAGTTVTVTNSLVTANSLVFCTLRTNDTTATVKNVVPTAGSFTINLGAAATGEVSIGFFVVN